MRRKLQLLAVVAAFSIGAFVACDPYQHVNSPAQATATAHAPAGATGTPPPATPTANATQDLVRVPPPTREQLAGCSAPGKRVCLVALGSFPDDLLESWAAHIRATYGIDVRVLAPVDALDAWQPDRQQVLAEGGISVVLDQYDPIVVDPDASLIVVTALDMTAHNVEPFVFGQTEGSRYSIVSGYHLDPRNRGAEPDEALYEQRMLKFVTKYVGITYFHAATSNSMATLMYGPINSVAILDLLPAELPAPFPVKVI